MSERSRSDALVGRRHELAALRGAVDRAAQGSGGAVVVLGEAGIGKSRLLAEVSHRAAAHGMEVLVGYAVPGGGSFRPIAAALADRLRERPGSVDHGVDGRRDPRLEDDGLRLFLPALDRLVPAWTAVRPAATGPALDPQPGVDPIVVLGEGVLRLLGLLAVDRGCVLMLEDLHWADADTLALVEYLAAAARSAGVLLAVSARDEGPRMAALTRFAGRPGATVLQPARLTASEVAALVDVRTDGAGLPADRLDLLMRRAEGLPLLVEDLVVALKDAPADSLASVVPPSFAALVAARLATLPPAAVEVVRAAAVLGPDPRWKLLSAMTGHEEAVVMDALRSATTAGLLAIRNGQLVWRHALTRDAVAGTLLPPERAVLARRAADALLDRGGAEDEGAAAELLVLAGEDGRAAELLLRLAHRDLARGALRSALALLGRVPQVGARAAEVAGDRVWLLTQLGQASAALEEGDRALGSATGAGHAELCLRLARTAVQIRQWDRALRYVAQAGRPDDPRTPLLAADVAFGMDDLDRAGALAADAVASAERAGTVQPLCGALELSARCAMQVGQYPAAAVALHRAASTASEHGLVAQRVQAEFNLALLAERMGSARHELLLAPRELAVKAGMLAEVARIDVRRANLTWLVDGPSAAEPVARASAELAGTLRLSPLQAVAESILAGTRAAAGDETGMRRLAATACARANRPPEVDAYVAFSRAMGSLLAGDLTAADEIVHAGLAPFAGRRVSPVVTHWGMWALLRAVAGDDEPRRVVARSSQFHIPENAAALAFADAVACGRTGRAAEATDRYQEGELNVRASPWWGRVLRMVVLHAAVADGWANRVDAIAALRTDLAEHERSGDVRLARTCRDLLRRAGAPTRRGRGVTPVPPRLRAAGVTSREMDVLVLVGERLTNAQVAERLSLSIRTVETHVANLLAKTGAANRGELRSRLAG